MKSNSSTITTLSSPRRVRAGFSLLEILLALAILSTITAVAVLFVGGTTDAARQTRLASDVATVNAAVKTYLTSGGSIGGTAKAGDVLTSLKTQAASTQAKKLATLRGSMVDPRLAGVEITTDGVPRAVWDNAKQRFVIATKGVGYKEFLIDQNAAVVAAAQETRAMTMPLGTESKWVWDFQDSAVDAEAPDSIPVMTYTGNAAPAPYSGMVKLLAPTIDPPSRDVYPSNFTPNMAVTLRDANGTNQAQLYYSVNNGAWTAFNNTPFYISPALINTVRAYSMPLNPDLYEQSDLSTATYESVYFSGLASGLFANPEGDPGMVTNLSKLVRGLFGLINAILTGEKKPAFDWGDPAEGFTKPNNMVFAGKSFSNIAPDQTFELGKLTYYNGTVYMGTLADRVDFEMDVNFTVPATAQEELTFTFELMSTENKGKSADADADFVYVPKVSTKFSTIIKGKTYYLVLSFGNNDLTNGFTTINTFHVHETKTSTGSVYGRFTTTPPQS